MPVGAGRRDGGSTRPSAARQPSFTPGLWRRHYCKRLPSSSAGVDRLVRAACWIIGSMRRARYSANLRAAGQVVFGASVLIGARGLLAWSPAGLLVISTLLNLKCLWHVGTVCHLGKTPASDGGTKNSENSKANRIETMKGPAESGQICSVGRRKIAKKIAKNKRCYANTLRPRSRMLLKVMKGG